MSRRDEELAIRIKKAATLRASGHDPYPARTNRTTSIQRLLADFEAWQREQRPETIAGRVLAVRAHGGSSFFSVADGTGQLQVFIRKDQLGEIPYDRFTKTVDVGDLVEVTGTAFVTKRGERSLLGTEYAVLTKTLLPLPEKWHGLSDVEIRYRKRYLDLLTNAAVKDTFVKRSLMLREFRQRLTDAGFMEVETPMLQLIPGGGNARPFVTHHHALDTDLYLRIAPELYLKRLVIGGYERVFEVARCFRNEGIDRDHNPEFTQIELYAAYWDYRQLMEFTERLLTDVIERVTHGHELPFGEHRITFQPPFPRVSYRQAVMDKTGLDISALDDAQLEQAARKLKVVVPKGGNRAKLIDELFKTYVRPDLIQPTFVIDHPLELSPLAKQKPGDPRYVERFQLLVAGTEMCNGFSELNDPQDQEARFHAQEAMRQGGDEEAQRMDEEFIEALRHGLPPTAGIGIGIDRFAALLNNAHSIKEVILFPTLKPKAHGDTDEG